MPLADEWAFDSPDGFLLLRHCLLQAPQGCLLQGLKPKSTSTQCQCLFPPHKPTNCSESILNSCHSVAFLESVAPKQSQGPPSGSLFARCWHSFLLGLAIFQYYSTFFSNILLILLSRTHWQVGYTYLIYIIYSLRVMDFVFLRLYIVVILRPNLFLKHLLSNVKLKHCDPL